ncbi:hypothetical protein Fmac_006943 [Flemingia macrophylla]|uniref:Uncharacterized protein n=1 Tax=Flemingia macrophylla TaxID=520843 RepID=A0ABD1NC23_9FABA
MYIKTSRGDIQSNLHLRLCTQNAQPSPVFTHDIDKSYAIFPFLKLHILLYTTLENTSKLFFFFSQVWSVHSVMTHWSL